MMAGPGSSPKPIRLTIHARGYLVRRGFTQAEVADTIRMSTWRPAQAGRWEAVKDFPFAAIWNGQRYATKRVRAIFVEEASEIVVVSVYTYFF
jgi:hypothetical protein